MSRLVSSLHDAAASPEAWAEALEALTDAASVVGAALIIFNKSSENVDEAYFVGPSSGLRADYVRHYAALGPYSPHCSTEAGRNCPNFFRTRCCERASGTMTLY
jgi:hypothetical protein